ncbi:MAG: hydroxyacid dehydrogenase [Anaerolineae bacterium]|nr:hydroxyacid dehydrogenase [Anaerolineae bacterium]
MPKGLFILGTGNYDKIYSPEQQQTIHERVDIYAPPMTADEAAADRSVLHDADVIFSGWGGPKLDVDFLNAAPHLKAVFYGAGSIRGLVTDTFWERNIQITSAAAANAVPVAEFTFAQIILGLKRGWHHALHIKHTGQWMRPDPIAGTYDSVVGLISLGLIGQRVADLLKLLHVKVIAYDPFVSAETAAQLNVELVSLDAVFEQADLVSLHTPWLPETVGMITGAHFAAMKPNTTFINTARGAVIREDEMIAVLQQRPDLYAVLDVTYPEPPASDSPLFTLPNVILTPHIAGCVGTECWRMGAYMVEELERYLRGEALRSGITRAQSARMA